LDWSGHFGTNHEALETLEACAAACLGNENCTGFEIPAGHSYCNLWLDGACSMGEHSQSWQPCVGCSDTRTYVLISAHPPPVHIAEEQFEGEYGTVQIGYTSFEEPQRCAIPFVSQFLP
jgi:hypothetical protein